MDRAVTPLAIGLIALLAYVGVYAELMDQRGGDISRFVIAGGPMVDASAVPPSLTVIPNIGGYDGISFYRLALDPFTRTQTAYGITLDNPSYRQQRILYPLLVWLLSLGSAVAVPTLLVVLNLAAIAVIGTAAAGVAQQYGHAPWWGLTVVAYPGFLLAFSRDTSEIAASAFALSAIWALAASRSRLAALLLCCAVFTRETTLLLVVAAFGVRWRSHRFESGGLAAAFPLALPLLLWIPWQLYLGRVWGVLPVQAGMPDSPPPFAGFLSVLGDAMSRRTVLQRLHFSECVFWLVVVAAVLLVWRHSAARLEWRLAWIGYLALASVLAEDVWTEHWSFMRVLADLFVVSAVVVLGARRAARWTLLVATSGLWWYVFSHIE